MKRRTLLHLATVSGAGLLAGCTGGGGEAPATATESRPPEPTPTTSPSASPTSTRTPCQTARTSTSFEVLSVECGTGENTADASVSPTGASTPDENGTPPTHTVTVTGTIDGADTCHEARLVAAELNDAADSLQARVESYVPSSDETMACGECIVDIDYELTVTFRCDYPGVVEIVHDGDEVARVPLPE